VKSRAVEKSREAELRHDFKSLKELAAKLVPVVVVRAALTMPPSKKSRRMMMTTVQQVLEGSGVFYISPDDSVFDAIAKNGRERRWVTRRDGRRRTRWCLHGKALSAQCFLKGRASSKTPVREVMEEDVFIARPEQSVEQCMALMTDRRVRHLAVLKGKS
jgi:signal-transduction protein with cAMP-binding, CBS, and nucleotidyltransferase domain